jgi:hypothetical protein
MEELIHEEDTTIQLGVLQYRKWKANVSGRKDRQGHGKIRSYEKMTGTSCGDIMLSW